MTALLDLSALSAFSLNTLQTRESAFSDTVSRISTGLRLTTAGDDIAAHMVSVRLDNRSRGWMEASRNIQNGLSLLEAADSGMSLILDALGRMRELAVESASGVYSDDHRAMMQREVETLSQHIYDSVETTEFNGFSPLAGNSSFTPATIDLTALLPTPGASGAAGPATQSGTYDVDITALGQRGVLLGNNPAFQLAAGDPPTILTITSEQGTVNVAITDADPPASWAGIINAAAAAIGVTALITDNTTLLDDGVTQVDPANSGYLMFRTAGVGSDKSISVVTNKFFDGTGFSSTVAATSGIDMQGTIEGTPFTAFGLTITAAPGSNGADGLSFTFSASPPVGNAGQITVVVPPAVVSDFTHTVQMAPDYLDEHVVSVAAFDDLLDGAAHGTLTLDAVDLGTQLGGMAGIDQLDALIQRVSAERSRIGSHMEALQGELTNAINGAYVTSSMEGRITDADMAAEATAMMQAQLAQQAQMSVLQALREQSTAALEFTISTLAASPLQAPAA
ncbi:MAG TPA: flagellin [Chloroflexota bacterium]|nr:flagellin [Chloroflexota bacterium]